jgi:hypothetical protein
MQNSIPHDLRHQMIPIGNTCADVTTVNVVEEVLRNTFRIPFRARYGRLFFTHFFESPLQHGIVRLEATVPEKLVLSVTYPWKA